MQHTKEERLEIGSQVYNGELKRHEAAKKYGVSTNCIKRLYARFYRDANALPHAVGAALGRLGGSACFLIIFLKIVLDIYAHYAYNNLDGGDAIVA